MEDSENEQNKKVATRVQPLKKLVKAAMGKRQLILQNKSKGNGFNNKKRIELRLRIIYLVKELNK